MEDNSHEQEGEENEEERGDVEDWQSGTQRLQNGTRDSDDADSESECGDHESENEERGDFARSRLVADLKKDQVELPCDHPSWEARRNFLEHLAR